MNQESPAVSTTVVTPPVAAVQPSTINQIDSIVSSVNTDSSQEAVTADNLGAQPSTSNLTDEANLGTEDLEQITTVGIIDQVRKRRIEDLVTKSINDPRFWKNLNRVDRLEDALVIPMFDDKSLQMFANSSKDELIEEAMESAIRTQTVPIMPTEEQIRARALKKHEEKITKLEKKAK